MSNNNEQNEPNFSCVVGVDSPYWVLAKYFQLIGRTQTEKKIATALLAYWQPLAAQYWKEDISSVKQSAINSIYRLQRQIHGWRSIHWEYLPMLGSPDFDTQREAIPLNLTYRINPDSSDYGVLKYFQSPLTTFTQEEMIWWSSSAYWQPLAQRALGFCYQESDWREAVEQSIKALKRHIWYLQTTFEVDFPSPVVRGKPTSNQPSQSRYRIAPTDNPLLKSADFNPWSAKKFLN